MRRHQDEGNAVDDYAPAGVATAIRRRRFSLIGGVLILAVGFGVGILVATRGFRAPEPQRACVPMAMEGFGSGTSPFLPLHAGPVHLIVQSQDSKGPVEFRLIKPAVKPAFPVTITLAPPGKADAFGKLPDSGHYTVSANGASVGTWRFTVDQMC